MLKTQVDYQALLESKRHNVEMENQNLIDLGIKQGTLEEARRHNLAYELETNRHNVEGEQISWFNAQETQRHNMEGEAIGWFNAKETQRHNLVWEDQGQQTINENIRHNKATEGIGYANIALGYANLAELKRHNVQGESLARRQVDLQGQDVANRRNQTAIQYMNAVTNRNDVSSRIKTNQAQIDKYNSDISLNREKLKTEESQQYLNYSAMVRNYGDTAKGAFQIFNSAGVDPSMLLNYAAAE